MFSTNVDNAPQKAHTLHMDAITVAYLIISLTVVALAGIAGFGYVNHN